VKERSGELGADANAGTVGAPISRRMMLGLIGLSAAGVVWGLKLQLLLEHLGQRRNQGLLSVLPLGASGFIR
jgi:hypothetical protein